MTTQTQENFTKKFKFYGSISKTLDNEDGTMTVSGICSANTIDSDGETITSAAMAAALPDYMEWGAVREMHGSNAAGKALSAGVNEDGTTSFECLVVDSEAQKKLRHGVYKGFSVGGRVTKRNQLDKKIIEGIELVEVSLVDRPANPSAKILICKNDNLDKENIFNDNVSMQENNTPNPDKVSKSLYEVSRLSSLLQELVWLQECIACDQEWSNNKNSIPDELKSVISALGGVLVNQVAAETQALPGAEESTTDVVEAADKTKDVNKAGAKHSKQTKETIKAVRDLLATLEVEESPAVEGATDVVVAETEKSKGAEDLKKFAETKDELAKALKDNEDLAKRVKELEAMPKPMKGVLGAISKGADAAGNAAEVKVDPVFKMGTKEEDPVATAIKKAQQTGRIVSL